jgi:hypothetical protein
MAIWQGMGFGIFSGERPPAKPPQWKSDSQAAPGVRLALQSGVGVTNG